MDNYINNNILLVLTKRDILPKSCYDEKFKEYFSKSDSNRSFAHNIFPSSAKTA